MKRIVLMGAAEGPWCSLEGIRNPVLRVNGARGPLDIEIMSRGCSIPMLASIEGDGELELHSLSQVFADAGMEWVRLSTKPPVDSSLICVVIHRKKAA